METADLIFHIGLCILFVITAILILGILFTPVKTRIYMRPDKSRRQYVFDYFNNPVVNHMKDRDSRRDAQDRD